jgi:N-acetyl-alpha-D-glucosaminyl L-malate synthase BshA
VAIEVIPNFVDSERFSPAPAGVASSGATKSAARRLPTLIHVSNFRAVKRPADVVQVFARVCAARAARPATLLMIGDGPERAATQALAQNLGLAAHVQFLGERIDLTEALRGSDVFVLPSETESFGLAALEAMACGVPVVASAVGGLAEVINHGETGFLAPLGDVDGMAARVALLLDDPALHARMSAAARQRAATLFQVAPAVDRYAAVYRRVLGR